MSPNNRFETDSLRRRSTGALGIRREIISVRGATRRPDSVVQAEADSEGPLRDMRVREQTNVPTCP